MRGVGRIVWAQLHTVEVFSGLHHTSSARKNIHQYIIIYRAWNAKRIEKFD